MVQPLNFIRLAVRAYTPARGDEFDAVLREQQPVALPAAVALPVDQEQGLVRLLPGGERNSKGDT